MAMLARKPHYRGPPAAPPLTKSSNKRRGKGPPPGAMFREKSLGIQTDPIKYAQCLVARDYAGDHLAKVIAFPPTNGASGGSTGGPTVWAGPKWNWEFGGGVAAWNLLANAELMTPIGRKFVPDPEYEGDGWTPPQKDPKACYFDNVVDLAAARLEYERRTFHSERSRGWPQHKPRQETDELDISAFTGIRAEEDEGTVVHDSTEQVKHRIPANWVEVLNQQLDFAEQAKVTDPREHVQAAIDSFAVDVGLRLYLKRYCKLSPSSLVILVNPGLKEPGVVRIVINSGGTAKAVMDMDDLEFYYELEQFTELMLRPEQFDVERCMMDDTAMETFYCHCLKHSAKVVSLETRRAPPVENEFETWGSTDLEKLYNWHADSSRRFNSSNPMTLDYVNPKPRDVDEQMWAKELQAADESLYRYWYFKKDLTPKYVGKVTLVDKPVVSKPAKTFFSEASSENARYIAYWRKLYQHGSDRIQQVLLRKGLTLAELFYTLKEVEASDSETEAGRYQHKLLRMQLFPQHVGEERDVSLHLFREHHRMVFLDHVKKHTSLLKGVTHKLKKWMDKPLFTPAKDVATAELKARLLSKRYQAPSPEAVKVTTEVLTIEAQEFGTVLPKGLSAQPPVVPIEFEQKIAEKLDKEKRSLLPEKDEQEVIAILTEQIKQQRLHDSVNIEVVPGQFLFTASFHEELAMRKALSGKARDVKDITSLLDEKNERYAG